MKRFLSIITLLIIVITVNAQTTIKGVLVDSLTNEGEPYATIRIYNVKNSEKPVAMALTDINGKFSPTVAANGNYVITISAVGRVTINRNFTVAGQKEIDLGTLLIRDDAKTLGAVKVVGQKPIVKMEADKMTYSVEDDPDSKAMTVLDMLRKVPMVTVDGQDNITVNGSSSFKVYVDGKPNPMFSSNASTIFKAMPASMVKSIEVVTNPGAKYDAEGAGGILDIKMAGMNNGGSKESLNGYNGSVNVNGGNKGVGGGFYIAGQQGKLSYNANANYTYMDNGTVDVTMTRKQSDGSTMEYAQASNNKLPYTSGNFAIGYEIDSLSAINASLGFTAMNIKNTSNPTTHLYGGVYGQGFSYGNTSTVNINNKSINGSLDYQRFFNAERSSSLTVTYLINSNPGKNDTETSYSVPQSYSQLIDLTDRASYGKTNTLENILQLDLVTKLSSVSTLNSGLKYANRHSTSDMDYYYGGKYESSQSTDYSNTDQIGAVYAEMVNQWQKWSLKAGLRYEQTWQKVKFNEGNGEDFTKQYGNLVPSASLSRTLKPGSSIGLTYNMRISRPGITYLNPYVDRTDPTALTYGNKDISVEKSHNVSLVFNSYSQKLMWNATLRQTFGDGGIEQYSFYDENNMLNTTYGNIVNRRVTSLTLFASWLMTRTTRLIFNGGGSYNDFRSKELNQNAYGWMGNAMFAVQQTLPKNWNVTGTIIANSNNITLQGTTSAFNMGIISVSKSLLNDKLSVSASFIAGLSKGGKLHLDQYSEGKGFSNQMNITVPLTRVQATVTWKFGNTKKQFQAHKTNVQNDYIEKKSKEESIGSVGNM